MNPRTSRDLARSLVADDWAAADRERRLQRASDDESRDDAARMTAPTGWASRLQRAVSLMSRRTAGDRALD